MGRAMPASERPTYEQLEETIRRKDNLFNRSWKEIQEIRSMLWMINMAHESNEGGYKAEDYAVHACIVAGFVGRRIRDLSDEIECDHRNVPAKVMAALPEEAAP